MTLKVGSLGSCRVATPLKLAAEAGKIQHIPPGALSFAHNPLEIIQGVRLLKRELLAPQPEIAKLTALSRNVEDRYSYEHTLQKADVIICELSSVRIVEYRSWQLQIHHFRNHLTQQGLKDPCMFKEGRSAALSLNGKAVAVDGADAFTRDLLEVGRCYEMDRAEIEDAVEQIIELIKKPIVFVCVSVRRPKNGDVPQRVVLRDAIASIAARHPDVRVFDPTEFLRENSFETVFRDLGHYNDAFIPTVADRLVSEIGSFWHTTQGGISHQDTSRSAGPI